MRKIIHIDMDCFYAAVEMRDNPKLRDKPIAVGAPASKRGVLCTCNYAARKYGIRSAMSSFKAKQLCKDLIIIPVNMEKYKAVSSQIQVILKKYTSLIEPLSLDEAYLDVTDCTQHKGSATLIAEAIRQEIQESLQLTASAGIAPNKLIAKVASDMNKPNGQYVVAPNKIEGFIASLPISKLFGVGKATQKKMAVMQIETCGDLQQKSLAELTSTFGKFGLSLYNYCRGIDNRPVNPSRIRKSVSVERTFEQDILTLEAAGQIIGQLIFELRRCLEKHTNRAIKSIFTKIKFNDFSQTTAERQSRELSLEMIDPLFIKAFSRGNKPFRLLGIGVSFANSDNSESPIQEQIDFGILQ